MDAQPLETIEQNPAAIYLLNVISEEAEDVCTCHALVLMKREGGVLLALPAGALPLETLQAAGEADPFTMYGPHVQCTMRLTGPGVDQESEDVEVLVIDADGTILAHLTPLPDPVPDNFVSFGPDPVQLPDFNGLMQFTREWIAGMQEDQPMAYYSAVEEPQQNGMGDLGTPTAAAVPKAAAKPKTKRPTTAALADQLAQVADILPQLTKQITALQKDHEEMRSQMVLQSQAVPPRKPSSCLSAVAEFCQDDGEPAKNKDQVVGPSISIGDREPRGPVARRSRRPTEPRRGLSGTGPLGAVEGTHQLGVSASSRWRPSSRWASRTLHHLIGFKGRTGPRQVADGIGHKIRRVFPGSVAERLQTDEASGKDPSLNSSSPGDGPLYGDLLGKVRWLRAISRDGAGPVLPGSHLRQCPSERHGRGARTHCALDDCSGASSSGWKQMGAGLPVDFAGGTAFSNVGIPPFHHPDQAEGICSAVPTAVGYSSTSICKGGGLHPESKERDEQESLPVSALSGAKHPAKAEAKEKAKMARRTRRKCRQQERRRGLDLPIQEQAQQSCIGATSFSATVVGTLDPLNNQVPNSSPSSSSSAQPASGGTANVGREDGHRVDAHFERAPWPDLTEGHQCSSAPGPEFDATSLEGVPISAWTNGHIRRILSSRTSFSLYLLRSFTLCRERSHSLATALFPIPSPFLGLWDCGLKKMNAAARRLAAKRKLLHVAVMALNFMHDRAPLNSLGLLQRRPAGHHVAVYERLMTIIKASVLSEVATIAKCGRKSHQLDARIHELYKVLVEEGLTEKSKYHQLSSKAPVDLCNDKAEELRPYRPLNASRLKITGQGQWDCTPFLGSLLYMPFVEPRFNEFDILPPAEVCPDVHQEDPEETDRLAAVWDARNLLRLVPEELAPADPRCYSRVFNNYKSAMVDRQIGDRRGQNFREGRLVHGPSHDLPTGVSLLQIMPRRFEEGLRGYVTDRRDFYHQFQTTWERSLTNVIYPLRPLSNFKGLAAHDQCLDDFGKRKKRHDRFISGDFLHGQRRSVLVEEGSKVAVSFGSLFQGDHLGVEFACDAHQNLLLQHGLLDPASRLSSSQAIQDDGVVEGLVIDDYFVLAKHTLGEICCECKGRERLEVAKAAYEKQNIYGSDDKDVWGEKLFKVVGAEIDARDELVRDGAVLCGVPAEKRMALASISALVSSWPCTSDSLHPSLVGSLVSALMFRRPLMAILNEVFHVIPASELDPLHPVLRKLPRKAAQEFALAAALCPIMVSNLAVEVDRKLYATDASNSMGGIASAEVPEELAKTLWRTADKKGANVPILSRLQAVIAAYEETEHEPSTFVGSHEEADGVPRPIVLQFDFIEVFGGAGVVTKHLCQMDVVCAPVMDISFSLQYDLMNQRVVEWLIFMLEERRIKAVLLAPPCTSFSPAAYPPCRSYENPLGFNRCEFKVVHGTKLAHASLCIMYTTMRTDTLGLLEQPRRSKMRWLPAWKRLVEMGMDEHFLASCSFGSIHMKEFCFAAVNMEATRLDRPCTGGHTHVKIEGKFTRPSATYVDGLAYELATVFKESLEILRMAEQATALNVDGLEDPLSNDIALAYDWKVEDSWKWKGNSHINVLETASTLRLMRKLARGGGDKRATYLGDSHVSRSCMAKGRSSSMALKPLLHQSAAISTAYGLYLAGRFAPTRLMPADHPSRGVEIPPPVPSSVAKFRSARALSALGKIKRTKRWASNWVRLVLLVCPSILDFHASVECARIFPAAYIPDAQCFRAFDSSLGFPGEGPGFGLTALPFHAWLGLGFYVILLHQHALFAPLLLPWTFSCGLGVLGAGAFAGRTIPKGISHGDLARQAARAGIELGEGRRTTEATAAARTDLLSVFCTWLAERDIAFDDLFLGNPPDLDKINQVLTDFGRWLFKKGKPYYHYSETINAVSSRRPILRRALQQAWDLAFMWGSYEPTEHHVGMPFQVLLAVLSTMLVWGWTREAACMALAWGALLRIGEVLNATRKDLTLPDDVAGSISYILLRIKEPKTRFRAARHQAGKMEQPDLISVVQLGFGKLKNSEPLWHLSGATLRHRLEKVLAALGLPYRSGQKPKALTLASLRAGGATWLITATESADLVKRRGRWASHRIMEIYLQEVSAATYLNNLDRHVRQQVLEAMELFPEVLQNALHFEKLSFPSPTWAWFFRHGTL